MGCGCKERREVMFDAGQPGKTEAIIIGTAVTLLAVAIYLNLKG